MGDSFEKRRRERQKQLKRKEKAQRKREAKDLDAPPTEQVVITPEDAFRMADAMERRARGEDPEESEDKKGEGSD